MMMDLNIYVKVIYFIVIIKIKYLVKNFEQDPDLDLVNNCISKYLNNVTNVTNETNHIYMQKYVMTIYIEEN